MKVENSWNPLTLKRDPRFVELQEPLTPNQLAEGEGVDLTRPTILNINGEWIPRAQWDNPIPVDAFVYFVSLPRGGGKGGQSNPLYIIGAIVVLVASYYTGGAAGAAAGTAWGSTAAGAIVGAVVQAVVAIGGMLLLNQFFGNAALTEPSSGAEEIENRYSMTAGRNLISLGSPFPEHMGRLICYPNLIMPAYTEYVDHEQYLYMLGVVGVGEYDVEEVYIDRTPMDDYSDASYNIIPPGGSPTYCTNLVWLCSETLGQEITTEYKTYIANPRSTEAYYWGFDIVFPSGLIGSDPKSGGVYAVDVKIRIEARRVNDYGTAIGLWVKIFEKTYSACDRSPQRFSEKIQTMGGTPRRYEIRIKRTTATSESTTVFDNCVIETIRSYGTVHPDYGDVTLFECRVKATDELSGDAASKINLIATRKLRTVGASSMNPALTATKNPVDIAAHIVTCDNGGKQDDDILDFDSLYELRAIAETRGNYFNYRFTGRSSVMDAVAMVARVVRAIPIMPGGMFAMVRDEQQSAPTQIYTDDDISEGSLSIVHSYRTDDSPTCVEIQYVDGDTFQGESVYCYDEEIGSLDNPATIPLSGCTDRQHAYEEGMYMYWDDQYSRTNVSFTTGLKGHIPGIGQTILVASNSIAWGTHGFIERINGNEIWLSHPVDFGEEYNGILRVINAAANVTNEIAVTKTNYSHCVEGTLSGVYTRADEPGQLPAQFVFGLDSTEMLRVRVVKIQPQSINEIKIVGTVVNDDIYAEPGEAPPYGYDYPDLDPLESVTVNYQGYSGGVYTYYTTWTGSAEKYQFWVWLNPDWTLIEDDYEAFGKAYAYGYDYINVKVVPYYDGSWQTGDQIYAQFDLTNTPQGLTATTAVDEMGILVSWNAVSGADGYDLIVLDGENLLYDQLVTTISQRFYFEDIRRILSGDEPPWPGKELTFKVRSVKGEYRSNWAEVDLDLTVPEPVGNVDVKNTYTTQTSIEGESPGDINGFGYTVAGFTILSGPNCHSPAGKKAWQYAQNFTGSQTVVSGILTLANCYESAFPYTFSIAAYYANMKAVDFLEFAMKYTLHEDGIHREPGPKTIDRNLTITCAPIGGDGDYIGDEALNQAVAWLNEYRIPNEYTVTIRITDGVYGRSAPLTHTWITHQDCNNIVVQGNTEGIATFNIASATNPPNIANDYIYVPRGSTTYQDFWPAGADAAWADFIVYIVGSTGNDGAYRVTNATVTGTDMRLTMESGTVTDATKDGILYLKKVNKCQLQYDSNNGASSNNPIRHFGAGILHINGISICNVTTSGSYIIEHPVTIDGFRSIVLSNMITSRWCIGPTASNGASLIANGTSYHDNVVHYGRLGYQPSIGGSGIVARHNAFGSANYAVVSNVGVALGASSGASFNADYAVASKSKTGFYSAYNSKASFLNSIAQYNLTGCRATIRSSIVRTGISNSGNTANYDPAGTPPIQGVDGSWIL